MNFEMRNDFAELLTTLKGFCVTTLPCKEAEIEEKLLRFLIHKGFRPKNQVSRKLGRCDLLVNDVAIELKFYATKQCAEQLDRYAAETSCKGLILMCWKASEPVRELFEEVKKTAKIPVALIEIRKNVW